MKRPTLTAIGLTAGLSMDGVDAVWIETDGERARRRDGVREAFGDDDCATLKSAIAAADAWSGEGAEPDALAAAKALIESRCLAGVQKLMAKIGKVDVIGVQAEHSGRALVDTGSLAREVGVPVVDDFRAAVAPAIDRANKRLSSIEQVRRFAISPTPFTTQNAMMTPSLKIRRHVISKHFAQTLERLYQRG